jgi:hypothetical protein
MVDSSRIANPDLADRATTLAAEMEIGGQPDRSGD